MHVLMTADTCGGVWTQAVELCRGLSGRGCAVTLATSGGLPTADQRASVEALPGIALHATSFKLEWQPHAAADVAAFGDRLEALCEQVRPDVVHLNEFSHGRRDFGVPKLVVGHSDVLSWHAAVRGCEAGPEWDDYRAAITAGLRGADLVVAPTAWMLGELSSRFGPFAAERVIYNGLASVGRQPHERMTGSNRCDAHGADAPRSPFVFAAGRYWDEGKNLVALAEVAPRLDSPVKLAGLPSPDGLTEPPAGVEFLGRLSPAQMTAAYRDAYVYCLPAKYEPFGLTPLEAARGVTPLVLGDIPSLREVWGDAAIYVPPDDRDALFYAIRNLERYPDEFADRALAATERAERYTRDAMTEGYLEAYRSLAGSASRTLEASGPLRTRETAGAA